MPTHRVNLDALIVREDFECGETVGQAADRGAGAITLENLKQGTLTFGLLKKPDFQRPTNNWTSEAIVRLVEAFLDGMLIPGIIVWHSSASQNIFVVDGAHRLSALIAWVNDDYGDGPISRKFYGDTSEFRKFHDATKTLMGERVGTYAEVYGAAVNGGAGDAKYQKMVRRGRGSGRTIITQAVEGTASTAEESFVAINESSVPIDDTELSVIRARRKPNAIATRALMRAGTQYYSKLPKAKEIDTLAKEVYRLIFGQLLELNTQSADVPRAGHPYSQEAFRMVLDMVNQFNGIPDASWQVQRKARRPRADALADETDGAIVLEYLRRVRDAAAFVSDHGRFDPGSLGMDMAVYAYADNGKFSPAGFLAAHRFALHLRSAGLLPRFHVVRERFEEFLVRHQSFIRQLGHIKGSRTRSLESIVALYERIFGALEAGIEGDEGIIDAIHRDSRLGDLKDSPAEENSTNRRRFPRSVQGAGAIRSMLQNRERCAICHARVPPAFRSKDHIVRVEDGGTGSLGNLQFTHPFCNTGIKEKQHSEALKASAP